MYLFGSYICTIKAHKKVQTALTSFCGVGLEADPLAAGFGV